MSTQSTAGVWIGLTLAAAVSWSAVGRAAEPAPPFATLAQLEGEPPAVSTQITDAAPLPAYDSTEPTEPLPPDGSPFAYEPEPPSGAGVSHTGYGSGGLSSWDLYAGSVYANTSPLWVQAEYLYWWMKGDRTPSLVTTSPAGTDRELAGVLGQPGTRTLFGGRLMGDDGRSGFRTTLGVRLGHWFDYFMNAELEAHVLWLDNPPFNSYSAVSNGHPILARPFYNTGLDAQDAQLVAFPNFLDGAIDIEMSSQLLSTGLVFRRGLRRGAWGRLDWLAGYRYVQLQEELQIEERLVSTALDGDRALGTTIDLYDRFATWNEFHGGELGLQFCASRGPWSVQVLAKAAIGGIARTVDVEGGTLVTAPAEAPEFSAGGLLALPSNIGRHRSCRFTMVPELGIRLRRHLTHSFILTMGYSVMAVDHVVRTGEQLDLMVNVSQAGGGDLIGAAVPHLPMADQTLWMHGFNIGLEW